MKTGALGILIAALLAAPAVSFAKLLNVDPAHASILFDAWHLKIAKVPGRFTDFVGTVDLDQKDITKSKVEFTVNMASITTASNKRDSHLRTADFFDVEKFPKATFKSTGIKKSGSGYVLTGDLTIRDVTKKVTFQMKHLGDVDHPRTKERKYVFNATGKINRKDFGVNYANDIYVSDMVDLSIAFEAIEPVPPPAQ